MQSKKINAKLQAMMLEIQQKLMGMQNRMMHRPMGSPKQMMQMLDREQNAGLERMIAALDMYKPQDEGDDEVADEEDQGHHDDDGGSRESAVGDGSDEERCEQRNQKSQHDKIPFGEKTLKK